MQIITLIYTTIYTHKYLYIYILTGHNVAEHRGALVQRLARQLFPSIESGDRSTYTLEEQIEHKVKFIRQYLSKSQKIILMAHSLGSFMSLSLLQRLSEEYNFVRIILMFPVFERTMETSKGTTFIPRLRNFRNSLIRTGHVIQNLPGPIRQSIISVISEKRYTVDDTGSIKSALKALLTPNCARNIVQMLDDLSKFGDNSKFTDIFTRYGKKLTLYYGEDDAWAPVRYATRLSEKFPTVDVRIDEYKTQHCFVLEPCKIFSKVISTLIDLETISKQQDNRDSINKSKRDNSNGRNNNNNNNRRRTISKTLYEGNVTKQ